MAQRDKTYHHHHQPRGDALASLGVMLWPAHISLCLHRRQRISSAATPSQLRQTLLDFDWGKGSLNTSTLRAWLSKLQQNQRQSKHVNLIKLVQELESACYSWIDTNQGELQQVKLLKMQALSSSPRFQS